MRIGSVGIIVSVVRAVYKKQEQNQHIFSLLMPTVKASST